MLYPLIRDHIEPVKLLDLGARHIEGLNPSYDSLLRHGACHLTCVEADSEACAALARRLGQGHEVVNAVIGDGDEHLLHLCAMRSRSSLFPPNLELAEKYQAFVEGSEVEERVPVQTQTLDQLFSDRRFDFIKLDLQGSEVMALRGGAQCLSRVLVAEIEVKFLQQYRRQPLFGEVDREARRLGWAFHTFVGYGSRPLKPMVIGDDPRSGVNQWLWADAVYMLHLNRQEDLEDGQLLQLALIMHDCYGSWDNAYRALRIVDSRRDSDFAGPYLELLQGPSPHA